MGRVDEILFKSPIGLLRLTATDAGISRIQFLDETKRENPNVSNSNPHLTALATELDAYFKRQLKIFRVPIAPEGTEFQKRVWDRLSKIPFGSTKTYGQIALELGQPTASRAVGGANNRNPIPIVVPCHRVIGTNNNLVGFACGVWRKQWMLEHEGIALPLG
ncbi:methylated-DNA--[protein]-cysteine S-methyltransferase [Pelagicoccus mobilis]|uniref:methylated-DNA--[protein]-cysteine S-methyltransferase n=1 Tax=Pelagicoccus mobilis TaxID=415221 RepID=UPI001F205373